MANFFYPQNKKTINRRKKRYMNYNAYVFIKNNRSCLNWMTSWLK